MSRLFSFYNNIIRPEMILKYQYKNTFNINYIDKVEVFILLNDLKLEEDLNVIRSFNLLEFFCLQRPFIKKFFIGSKQGKKSIFILFKCSLRNKKMFNFLDYFINLTLPLYESRQLKFKSIFDKNNSFVIFIKDMNVFFKLSEKLLSFDKGFFFIVRFSKNFYNKKILTNMLKHFNFYKRLI